MITEYNIGIDTSPGPFSVTRQANKLIKVLKSEGLKRKFFTHPASEVYANGKITAKIERNWIELSEGCIEHGVAPYKYGSIRAEISGENSDLPESLVKKLNDLYR